MLTAFTDTISPVSNGSLLATAVLYSFYSSKKHFCSKSLLWDSFKGTARFAIGKTLSTVRSGYVYKYVNVQVQSHCLTGSHWMWTGQHLWSIHVLNHFVLTTRTRTQAKSLILKCRIWGHKYSVWSWISLT